MRGTEQDKTKGLCRYKDLGELAVFLAKECSPEQSALENANKTNAKTEQYEESVSGYQLLASGSSLDLVDP